jgi:glutamate/aspartate transport system substrate-binding protein
VDAATPKIARTYGGFLLLLTIFLLVPLAASASDTMQRISKAKEINIGYRTSSVPLSFVEKGGAEPVGYNIDICKAIVENVKKELKLGDLRIGFVQVNGATRVPMLLEDKIDLECGSTTHTLEREKFVAFSVNTIIDEDQAIVKKGAGVRSLADLDGKTIAVNPSSSVTMKVRSLEIAKGYKFKRIYVLEHDEGMAAVESGKVAAYFELRSVLAGLSTKTQDPREYAFLDIPLDEQPIAIMMRKDDHELKEIANRTIVAMAKSGDLDRLYDKWFLSESGRSTASLNLPKNPATVRHFANPTDAAAVDEGALVSSLYNMPIWVWAGALVIAYVLLAVGGLYLYLRAFRSDPADDKVSRDFSQMAMTAVGGIASLVLGFTMFTSMSAYSAASGLVAEEANSIGALQEAAIGLDRADRAKITDALSKYAKIVIDQEWIDQMEGLPVFSFPGNAVLNDLHRTIANLSAVGKDYPGEARALLVQGVSRLYRARLNRLIAADPNTKIPLILWGGIVISSILTIFCSYLIGYKSKRLHYATVSVIALSFSMFLVVIVYIDRPFLGRKGVSSEPYQIVLENFAH